MAEKFGLRKSVKVGVLIDLLWPLVCLGGGIAMAVLVSTSGGFFQMKWWFPFFMLGVSIWAIVEGIKFARCLKFFILVDHQGISVNEKHIRWDQVSKADFSDAPALYGQYAIVLHLQSGEAIKIPAGLDGLPYVRGMVEANVKASA